MRNLRRLAHQLFFPFVFLFAAFGYMQAYALADGGGATAPSLSNPLPLPAGWAGLALVLLTVASWGVRKLSTKSAFFHTTGGAALMGTLTAVLPAVIQAIQSHGLQLISIETAVLGAVLSFVASDNASNSAAVQAAIVEEKQSNIIDSPTTPPNKIGMLLPFVGITFLLSLAACPAHTGNGTATVDGGSSGVYTTAFESCLKSDGVQLGTSDGSQVLNILDSGESQAQITDALEGLGITTGGQLLVDIGSCAISSWLNAHPIVAGVKPTPPQAALRVYLARHPSLVKK